MSRPLELIAILEKSKISSSPQGTLKLDYSCSSTNLPDGKCRVEIQSMSEYSLNDDELTSLNKIYNCVLSSKQNKSTIGCFIPESDYSNVISALNYSSISYLTLSEEALRTNQLYFDNLAD